MHDTVQRARRRPQFADGPQHLRLVGDVGAQHHDAGTEGLKVPQPPDPGAGGVAVVVSGEVGVPVGGRRERRPAQQAEDRTVCRGRDVLGHGQAEAPEAAGDEVDAAVAQSGAPAVAGGPPAEPVHPVETARPHMPPAQGQFGPGVPAGAGEGGEDGAYVVLTRGVRVGAGDVQDPADGAGGLLGDHRGRAEQQGVLGPQRFLAGDLVHAAAEHVEDGRGGQPLGAQGPGEGEEAVEAGAARGVQPLPGELGTVRVLRGAVGGAPQVHEAEAPPVPGREGRRGQGRGECGQVVGVGGVHGPGVLAGAFQKAARADAYDAVAAGREALGEGVAEGESRAEDHPGVAGGHGRARGGQGQPLPAGGVEPAVRVGGGSRAAGEFGGLDPVAAPLEGVAGQPHRAAAARALDRGPVDGDTGAPRGAEAPQQVGVVGNVLAGVPQGADGTAARAPTVVGAGEVGEVLAGADLQQDEAGVGEQDVEGVAEPHRLTQVGAPVLGAGRLLGGEPGAGDVRQHRNLRGVQGDTADRFGEGGDGAVHAGGVEGVRGVQAAAAHALVREPPFEGVDSLGGAGDHGERRGVDGRQSETLAEAGGGLLLGQEDAEHGAVRHLLDQSAPGSDEPYGVLEREHARQARGDVLADAVPGHGARLDAPGLPLPGQGELHAEQRGLGELGLPQPLRGLGTLRAEHQGAQILPEVRGEQLRAAVELGGEDRLLAVQAAGHAGVLGALPGEEERDRGGVERGGRGRGLREPAQRGDGLPGGAGDGGAAVGETGPAAGQGVGDGVQGGAGVGLQVVGEPGRRRGERGRGLRGQRQQPGRGLARGRAVGLDRLLEGGLLQDEVDVGATDAEGGHPGPARGVRARPGAQVGIDVERAAVQLQPGVGPLPVQRRRDRLVLEGENRFDQAGDTGGGVEVADVALDRADRARAPAVGARAVGAGEGGDLDGVAEGGAGAVGLYVADGGGVDVGQGQRLGDDVGLAVDARRGVTGFQGAVVVDGAGEDDRVDAVAVGPRVGEAAQHDDAGAVAGHGALGVGVEGAAGAVRGEDAAGFVQIAAAQRGADGHPAGQGDVALAAQQALAGEVHCGQ